MTETKTEATRYGQQSNRRKTCDRWLSARQSDQSATYLVADGRVSVPLSKCRGRRRVDRVDSGRISGIGITRGELVVDVVSGLQYRRIEDIQTEAERMIRQTSASLQFLARRPENRLQGCVGIGRYDIP